ncbi:hypothetical protein BJV82DRAFT_4549 [Fennellomyces sp. T-0311]|nr:hypothetical protein BJV82DRAFT_4549 [Fennellomyces sp. T-0311]
MAQAPYFTCQLRLRRDGHNRWKLPAGKLSLVSSRSCTLKTVKMHPQLTYEERQQQLQQRITQRRRNLQSQLLEQQSVVEEIQRMQGSEVPEGETRLRIGQPPLDTDRIAAIGISVGSLQEKTVWVGGFSICWINSVCAPHVSSYVCLYGGNFYPELLALKSALNACPPNESLAVLTQSVQLVTC